MMEQANGAAVLAPWESALGAAPSANVAAGGMILPHGSIEMVLVLDPAKYVKKGMPWRLSIEHGAYCRNPNGTERRVEQIVPRVRHSFRVLYRIMRELASRGFRPVYGRKESGKEEFVVGLWQQANNPRQAADIGGYAVRFFDVENGKQCPLGFDEVTMAVWEDMEAFA